jgi:hypothetical protein
MCFSLEKADQDTVYEQDLLRNPGSIKPWLAYIEYKQQNGTLYEQAFVSRLEHYPFNPLLNFYRSWSALANSSHDPTSFGRW